MSLVRSFKLNFQKEVIPSCSYILLPDCVQFIRQTLVNQKQTVQRSLPKIRVMPLRSRTLLCIYTRDMQPSFLPVVYCQSGLSMRVICLCLCILYTHRFVRLCNSCMFIFQSVCLFVSLSFYLLVCLLSVVSALVSASVHRQSMYNGGGGCSDDYPSLFIAENPTRLCLLSCKNKTGCYHLLYHRHVRSR